MVPQAVVVVGTGGLKAPVCCSLRGMNPHPHHINHQAPPHGILLGSNIDPCFRWKE